MTRDRTGVFAGTLGVQLLICIASAAAGPLKDGCTEGCGTVFSVDLKTGTETVLYSFSPKGHKDGTDPLSALVAIGSNALYGTAQFRGAYEAGTVFAIDRKSGAETIVHTFTGGADGNSPDAGLVQLGGLLYGTTELGGAESCGRSGCGTVYSIDPDTGNETVVYSFGSNATDGNSPMDELTGVGGRLYGTTYFGGSASCRCGTVFEFDPANGSEKVLYSFGNGNDGANPVSGLTNLGGTLYGTTWEGGKYNGGTVFSLNPATGDETVLHAFQGSGDGFGPLAAPVPAGGTLYGTTCEGGANDDGSVYSVDPDTGSVTVLHSFQNSDGNCPSGGLIEVGSTLYGTTQTGGPSGAGIVFSITTSGVETTVYNFNRRDGRDPVASLRLVAGKLYGTTAAGGHPE